MPRTLPRLAAPGWHSLAAVTLILLATEHAAGSLEFTHLFGLTLFSFAALIVGIGIQKNTKWARPTAVGLSLVVLGYGLVSSVRLSTSDQLIAEGGLKLTIGLLAVSFAALNLVWGSRESRQALWS